MSAYNFKTFLENLKNPQAKACLIEDAVETEQKPVKYAEEMKHHQKLIQAVKNSCNCDTDEEAWNKIVSVRQSMEDDPRFDSQSKMDYIQRYGLRDLGLGEEIDIEYLLDFLTVPYVLPGAARTYKNLTNY